MQVFRGFIVAGDIDRDYELWKASHTGEHVPGYSGIEGYHLWALDDKDDAISEELWHERYESNGAPNNPVSSIEHIRRYLSHCSELGVSTNVFAVGVDEETEIAEAVERQFIGYDCVVENNDTTSYLYCDGVTDEEAAQLGVSFTPYGLFKTEDDALKFARYRRNGIELGEDIEDCGPEAVSGFALVKLK